MSQDWTIRLENVLLDIATHYPYPIQILTIEEGFVRGPFNIPLGEVVSENVISFMVARKQDNELMVTQVGSQIIVVSEGEYLVEPLARDQSLQDILNQIQENVFSKLSQPLLDARRESQLKMERDLSDFITEELKGTFTTVVVDHRGMPSLSIGNKHKARLYISTLLGVFLENPQEKEGYFQLFPCANLASILQQFM